MRPGSKPTLIRGERTKVALDSRKVVTKDGLDRRRILRKIPTCRGSSIRVSGTGRNHDLTQVDQEAATGDARRLLAWSRLPPIRGCATSAPRYELPCVGCLKQMPNAVFQQFDGPLQGTELSNPHYRDGHVQVK